MARRSSEAEEVLDCSRLNWWVTSNHQPPGRSVRHRGVLKEWGGSEALPTPPNLCAWRDIPPSPARGGSGERNAARFFAASAAPSRGVRGTKLWPFFSRILARSESRPCFRSLQNALKSSLLAARDETGTKPGNSRFAKLEVSSRFFIKAGLIHGSLNPAKPE